MRDDQFEKLEALQEKLVDAILVEADPDNWPGADKKPGDLSRDERGDRYWCKKNASASLSVLNKTLSLAHFRDRQPPKPADEDAANDEMDKEIAQAEKQAAKILDKFMERQQALKAASK